MDSVENRLNEFFITTFNKILNSEERSLQKSELTDISVREIHIIEAVGLSKPYAKNTMSNIASEVGISLGALSTAVNALVRKGYISKGKYTYILPKQVKKLSCFTRNFIKK